MKKMICFYIVLMATILISAQQKELYQIKEYLTLGSVESVRYSHSGDHYIYGNILTDLNVKYNTFSKDTCLFCTNFTYENLFEDKFESNRKRDPLEDEDSIKIKPYNLYFTKEDSDKTIQILEKFIEWDKKAKKMEVMLQKNIDTQKIKKMDWAGYAPSGVYRLKHGKGYKGGSVQHAKMDYFFISKSSHDHILKIEVSGVCYEDKKTKEIHSNKDMILLLNASQAKKLKTAFAHKEEAITEYKQQLHRQKRIESQFK